MLRRSKGSARRSHCLLLLYTTRLFTYQGQREKEGRDWGDVVVAMVVASQRKEGMKTNCIKLISITMSVRRCVSVFLSCSLAV